MSNRLGMKRPKTLMFGYGDGVCCRCYPASSSATGRPYVDAEIDTIPRTDDDPDYSESPSNLRTIAAWLVAAADWLERQQEKGK
jgi:hypothetical protein